MCFSISNKQIPVTAEVAGAFCNNNIKTLNKIPLYGLCTPTGQIVFTTEQDQVHCLFRLPFYLNGLFRRHMGNQPRIQGYIQGIRPSEHIGSNGHCLYDFVLTLRTSDPDKPYSRPKMTFLQDPKLYSDATCLHRTLDYRDQIVSLWHNMADVCLADDELIPLEFEADLKQFLIFVEFFQNKYLPLPIPDSYSELFDVLRCASLMFEKIKKSLLFVRLADRLKDLIIGLKEQADCFVLPERWALLLEQARLAYADCNTRKGLNRQIKERVEEKKGPGYTRQDLEMMIRETGNSLSINLGGYCYRSSAGEQAQHLMQANLSYEDFDSFMFFDYVIAVLRQLQNELPSDSDTWDENVMPQTSDTSYADVQSVMSCNQPFDRALFIRALTHLHETNTQNIAGSYHIGRITAIYCFLMKNFPTQMSLTVFGTMLAEAGIRVSTKTLQKHEKEYNNLLSAGNTLLNTKDCSVRDNLVLLIKAFRNNLSENMHHGQPL